MIGWAEDWKIGLVHIEPGKPMQNGHVENFDGRLRDECLGTSWFRALNDARETLANWRREFHCERPHSSPDYRTPEEFGREQAMRIKSQSKTDTGKLQLSTGEKKGQVTVVILGPGSQPEETCTNQFASLKMFWGITLALDFL